MLRALNYADAVRLLGGQESRTAAVLDKLVGGLLQAASATGWGLAVNLFDTKAELVAASHRLVAGLDQRLAGLSQFDRTERLAAANAIIVVAAYFEVMAEVNLPFSPSLS